MILDELLSPARRGPLADVVVEAVSSLPLDDAPAAEGDDSIHAGLTTGPRVSRDQPMGRGPLVVPFVRNVRPGTHGEDVLAFQRALIRADVRHLRATGWHGPVSVRNVEAFKRAHNIRATSSAPFDGVYDLATHHHLARYFDSYGAWLMMQSKKALHEHEVRLRIVATALFGVAERDRIAYSQGPHRLDAIREAWRPPRYPVATDCSGFATWCYFVAGGPDPNGHDFDVRRPEWTGAMAAAGRRVDRPTIGDLCLYGRGPQFEHVTICIDDHRCVSNGSPAGPLVLPIAYRSDLAEFRSYL